MKWKIFFYWPEAKHIESEREHFFSSLVCTKAGDNVETVTAHVVGVSAPKLGF